MIALPGIERTRGEQATAQSSAVRLEHLFTCRATLRIPRESVATTPDGLQLSFNVTGGRVSGPRVTGSLRAIGTDWLTVQPDGSGVLDLRIAIETVDGALIYAPFQGAVDHGKHGHQRALQGSLLRDGTLFQIAPRFQSADTGYQWLNGLRCIGLGQVFPERGEARCAFYDIHSGDHA